jgi:hypothetical protein
VSLFGGISTLYNDAICHEASVLAGSREAKGERFRGHWKGLGFRGGISRPIHRSGGARFGLRAGYWAVLRSGCCVMEGCCTMLELESKRDFWTAE